MRLPTTTAVLPVVALIATLVVGCADDAGTQRSAAERGAASAPTTPSIPSIPSRSEPDAKESNPMQIQITIGDQTFDASLDDSPSARDLAAQLPVTIDMTDHGGVEKTGPLPSPLSLDGAPEGADPDVGALGYYAPGNDLVLYYGDQSYFPGIVVIGRLEGDAASRIADLEGPVTATVVIR